MATEGPSKPTVEPAPKGQSRHYCQKKGRKECSLPPSASGIEIEDIDMVDKKAMEPPLIKWRHRVIIQFADVSSSAVEANVSSPVRSPYASVVATVPSIPAIKVFRALLHLFQTQVWLLQ